MLIYKNEQIKHLRKIYNKNGNALKSKYNLIINYIKSLKLPINVKNNKIQYFIRKYRVDLNAMKKKFNQELKAINLLNNVSENIIPKKYALIIGINYIHLVNELSGCINDANNMNKFLNDYSYKNENIVVLTDDTTLKPTKQHILSEFTNLLKKSVPGDSLVFYYSGHGTYSADLNGDDLDGRDEFIVAIDSLSIDSCILDDELKTIIYNNLKQGVKLFILMDCCFSGTICDLKYNYIDKDNFDNTTMNPNSSETLGQVICISGCSDNQTSSESTVTDGVTHTPVGAMTFAFIKTISEKGDKISMNELLESMRTLLSDNMYEQTVQMSSGCQIDISNTLLTDIF